MENRSKYQSMFKLFILATIACTTAVGNANQLDRQQVVARGVAFLLTAGQAEDGSFSKSTGPAVTALCVTALLRSGASVDQPAVARALKFLQGFVQKDGGIYQPESLYQNYETCLAIMCLAEANRDGRYTKIIERAAAFVKQIQWDETEGIDESDVAFGGAGYGKHGRPDLSNTSYLVDAIRASGADENDEAIQEALRFVSRCQNHESEHNTTKCTHNTTTNNKRITKRDKLHYHPPPSLSHLN